MQNSFSDIRSPAASLFVSIVEITGETVSKLVESPHEIYSLFEKIRR